MITTDNAASPPTNPTRYYSEASDLGWGPGHWPRSVETTLGNGQPLHLVRLDENGGFYRQEGGVTVMVFND